MSLRDFLRGVPAAEVHRSEAIQKKLRQEQRTRELWQESEEILNIVRPERIASDAKEKEIIERWHQNFLEKLQ